MLDASGRNMIFLRRNAAGQFARIAPTADGVIRSTTLAGFQFRIDDLYRQPSLVELSNDEVYRGFVLPELTAARVRAEAEQARAEAEQARAEAEQARAEAEQARAEAERARAEREYARAEQEREHAVRERARADHYAAKLRELGIDGDTL
jgi:nucleoid-associated protein YgaU